ncbi:MAG: YDG/SRA domain-containing protein [Flavobacteriaceae bacterium]
MPREIIFGEITGIQEGQWFEGRKEMMPTSFHRNWGAGIDGNGSVGTAAIVLSGGYEDDKDLGDEIIYTGAGGNDANTGKQVADQTWTNRGNAGLLKSMNEGLPVRVIRGHKHKSPFSPTSGYSYAGLYSVVDAWQETGKSGFKICRFRLVYAGDNMERKSAEEIELDLDHDVREKKRVKGTVLRIVRDTKLAHDIKALYNHKCQVCGIAIPTKNGFYSEGAHIKPLGKPHNGDDSLANLICLCPNHHVMFDKGSFSISDNYNLLGAESGELTVHPKHNIEKENLNYHRESHGYN